VNRSKRRKIFERLRAANPRPATELEYGNPFQLLVAVVLSAQSTDAGVNKATRSLFRKVKTPAAMLDLGEEGLKQYIRTIGLFNTKASKLIKACSLLVARHDGVVPEDRKALEALPGVGRKTANVILNTAFGQPTIAVDTHIFRVANRTGIAPGKNVTEVENRLLRLVPEEFRRDAHHWLILLGRYTCIARKPHCTSCPIQDLCEYPHKNLDQEPVRKKNAAAHLAPG
jgi:endonuclease III